MTKLNNLFFSIFNKHPFFLLIFSGYIISILLFGEPTLFYIDRLDIEIVLNHVLGKVYRGDFDAVKIFLGGEIEIRWLRRLFNPFNFLYAINTEFAYWTIDIACKIFAYFCFFLFSKKIIKNTFICSVCAAIFASLQNLSVLGFFIPCFPYFLYLVFFKKIFKKKHFFLTLLYGLNSDAVVATFLFPSLIIFQIIFEKLNKLGFINSVKMCMVFYPSLILSNSNIIYSILFDGPFHRSDFFFEYPQLSLNFLISQIFSFDFSTLFTSKFFRYELASSLPHFIFAFLFYPFIILARTKKLYFLIILHIFLCLQELVFYQNFFLFKYLGLEKGEYYLSFIYACIALLLIINFKFLIYSAIILILLAEVSSSLIPFAKTHIDHFKVENYRNYYTFRGYYLKDTYSQIKKRVQDNRIMSLYPLDPMVAVMNDIKVIDGEHNLYPLTYKKKFYEIIKDELEQNQFWKNYYLNYGLRLYSYNHDYLNIKSILIKLKKWVRSF